MVRNILSKQDGWMLYGCVLVQLIIHDIAHILELTIAAREAKLFTRINKRVDLSTFTFEFFGRFLDVLAILPVERLARRVVDAPLSAHKCNAPK